MADDFCRFFDKMMEKHTLKEAKKRKYHRDGTLSKAEVMVILILFHGSCYRCLKHFYLEHKAFIEFLYGKLVGDKGYIGKELFQRLFVDGIQLITKLKSNMKDALMTMSDRLLTRKRAIIETVNNELKNIAQVEHSRHRSFDNFMVNLLGALAAYCFFPKKPCIACDRTVDNQLTLFLNSSNSRYFMCKDTNNIRSRQTIRRLFTVRVD